MLHDDSSYSSIYATDLQEKRLFVKHYRVVLQPFDSIPEVGSVEPTTKAEA